VYGDGGKRRKRAGSRGGVLIFPGFVGNGRTFWGEQVGSALGAGTQVVDIGGTAFKEMLENTFKVLLRIKAQGG